LAAIAEFCELIVERTVDGLNATRARGRKGGRKQTLTAAAVRQAQAMYDSGQYTVDQIAAAFKTTRPTIYRALDPRHGRQETDQLGQGAALRGHPDPKAGIPLA